MSCASDIPEAVRALLRDQVTTFEALALLMQMHANPHESTPVESLASRVCVPPDLTVVALQSLRESALVACRLEGKEMLYHYAPGNSDLANAVDTLARTYEEQRVAMINILNASAIDRVRSGAVRAFADAFILRRRERKDG